MQYQDFKVIADESIIQPSHKIDCLITDLYYTTEFTIKLGKLLEFLPNYIRIKKINYHVETEHTQTLLDISHHHITSF